MGRAMLFLLALPVLAQHPAVANRPSLQARFLSKAAATQVLTGDDYFKDLQVAELRAKTGLPLGDATPAQARIAAKAHYASEAQDFTPEEQRVLQGVLDRMAPAVVGKAPLMARTPFCFIKAGEGVEGGLPHTRGACIVLSPMVLRAMVMADERGARVQLDQFASDLLVHEQTHVLEREHPEVFAPLFTEVFGFRRLTSLPDDAWLKARRVVNPDGPDLAWAFPITENGNIRWIRPDLLLKTLDHPRMPQDFRMVAVDLKEQKGAFALALDPKGQPEVEDLASLPAYRSAFPNPDEFYHPNEIAADLLAAWITGHGDGDPSHPMRITFATWAIKALR